MEEDIKLLKENIDNIYVMCGFSITNALERILNELEILQKEFKIVDHECSRLEKKELELENENEHYKDLIDALETYYSITEEDLENCIKKDK